MQLTLFAGFIARDESGPWNSERFFIFCLDLCHQGVPLMQERSQANRWGKRSATVEGDWWSCENDMVLAARSSRDQRTQS
jgi:hypothetical protein